MQKIARNITDRTEDLWAQDSKDFDSYLSPLIVMACRGLTRSSKKHFRAIVRIIFIFSLLRVKQSVPMPLFCAFEIMPRNTYCNTRTPSNHERSNRTELADITLKANKSIWQVATQITPTALPACPLLLIADLTIKIAIPDFCCVGPH